MRTFLYKLTSDRGGAPCAPPPLHGQPPLLTLSICKPAIRRTARPGDRLVGITSRALVTREHYPADAIIYAAIVDQPLDARDYYKADGEYRPRPDCIYVFDENKGTLRHTGQTPLHANPAYAPRDIGRHPYYKNARALLCTDFRYFGSEAVPIPPSLHQLLHAAQSLGQGHRVFDDGSPESLEADALFRRLWRQKGLHTPAVVTEEAYGHAPACRKPEQTPPA